MAGDSAWIFLLARRYDEAIVQSRKAIELDANYAVGHCSLGWSFFWKGDRAGAMAEFQKARALDPQPWFDASLGYVHAVSGDRAKAEQLLRDLDDLAKQRYVSPTWQAYVYLGLGEKKKALDWLEKCYTAQDFACYYLKSDQLYDPLRHEPRFQALVKKVGLDQ